ncbi:hypothetical protein PBY51_019343 [Eleginops maclovinus]|uniref:Interleukin-17C n=2 Tax=Eleginops maclovinus TaxID=56733 RepID=A0AAN7YHA3_ELEMC|nr:hypothetical protein PBY51_019343 [Eleginops maclovinus]
MTTFVSLQMISIGSLLVFNAFISTSANGNSSHNCLSAADVKKKGERFEKKFAEELIFTKILRTATRNCSEAAAEMREALHQRSLSPWMYIEDRDDDRFPHVISFAKCLCEGCIINKQENFSYNSVLVYAQLPVMEKTKCDGYSDRYKVKQGFINVPVACTCVVPNYTK